MYLVGALSLAVFYALVQDRASQRVNEGVAGIVGGIQRLMKPGVAGIGDHSKKPGNATTTGISDTVSNVVAEATQAASGSQVGYGMSSTYEQYYQGMN